MEQMLSTKLLSTADCEIYTIKLGGESTMEQTERENELERKQWTKNKSECIAMHYISLAISPLGDDDKTPRN